MGFIVFMVLGLIILGMATPSEAAASGTIATLMVVILYGRFTWDVMLKSLQGTITIAVMVLTIIAASKTFSNILAFSGATQGLLDVIQQLKVHPLVILISMQILVFFLGAFMETVSIMMITLPIFMPIIHFLGMDPIWFGVIMLINLEMGQITPPFGMLLFVMKGVAPENITIDKICQAAIPYIVFDILVMALIIIFPSLVLWLAAMVA
jgi:tripartite ATP-independent transporter DctM subunit